MREAFAPAPDETALTPEQVRERNRSSRTGIGLGQPKTTECMNRVTFAEREESRRWLPVYDEYADQRPKTRGDCVDAPRPCPWVSCRFHTYLDVKAAGSTAGRSIVFNFPDRTPDEIPADRSCALDIADLGGATLEDVAKLTNLTRERIRQVQTIALVKAGKNVDHLAEFVDDLDRRLPTSIRGGESSLLRTSRKLEIEEVSAAEEEDADADINESYIDFLSDHPNADELITNRIYRIYIRESTEKGFEKRKRSKREIAGEVPAPAERGWSDEKVGVPQAVDPLSTVMAPRHNGSMASKKRRKKVVKPDSSMPELSARQKQVLATYKMLKQERGYVPNNVAIGERLNLSAQTVGLERRTLVARKLMQKAPMGKAPSRLKAEGVPNMKHTHDNVIAIRRRKKMNGAPEPQLPIDDVMQTAATVLSVPEGPVADAANGLRDAILKLDEQRNRLAAALNALGG